MTQPRIRLFSLASVGIAGALGFVTSSGMLRRPPTIVYPVIPLTLPTRVFIDAELDTIFSVGSFNSDDLLNPIRIAATTDAVFVFDAGDQSLKSFDGGGRVNWATGREGSGPGEFRKVRTLSIGVDGSVLVVDQANGRLTRVGTDGTVRAEISMKALSGSPEQIAEVAPDTFVTWTLTPERPLAMVDRSGTVLRTAVVPFSIADAVPYLGAQAKIVNDYRSPRTWVYGFIFVSRWRSLNHLEPVSPEYEYIEEIPLPTVEMSQIEKGLGSGMVSARMQNAVQGALSASLVGRRLFVLFGGRTKERGTMVDVYDVGDGSYEFSIRLPMRANEIAVTDERIVIMARDPFPTLTALNLNLPRRTDAKPQ